MPSDPTPYRPTTGSVIVTLLIFVAAATLLLLFLVPVQSSWFWPIAGVLAASMASAFLIPITRR